MSRYRPVTVPNRSEKRMSNAPDIIRSAFVEYLRRDFPYGYNWIHPTTLTEYEHDVIKEKLERFRNLNSFHYRALWCLWTTQQSRTFIANHFNFSGSSVRRLWNRSIDAILVMLFFPELEPEVPVNLYNSRNF